MGIVHELLLMSDTTCVLDSVVLEPTQVELESDNPGRTSHPYRQVLCSQLLLPFLLVLALTCQGTVVLALLRSSLACVVTVILLDKFAIQSSLNAAACLLHGALSAE